MIASYPSYPIKQMSKSKKQKTSCDVVHAVTVCNKKSFQIDKALKMQQSFHTIMFLELILQPCKGSCKEVVMCTCLSNVLSNEKYDKETIKEYFRQFLSMLWTMDQEGTAILMSIAEWISSLCAHLIHWNVQCLNLLFRKRLLSYAGIPFVYFWIYLDTKLNLSKRLWLSETTTSISGRRYTNRLIFWSNIRNRRNAVSGIIISAKILW